MSKRIDAEIEKTREDAKFGKLRTYQEYSRRMAEGERLGPTEIKLFRELEREFSRDIDDNDKTPEYIDSFEDAAAYLGVSKRTLQVNTGKHIKQELDGTYKKSELDKWLDTHKTKGAKAKLTDLEAQKLEADVRFRVSRAMREELLYKQMRGEYFSKKQVLAQWSARLTVLCSSLENFADRLPPLLFKKARAEMYEIIRNEIDELRTTLCQGGEYCPQKQKKAGRPRSQGK